MRIKIPIAVSLFNFLIAAAMGLVLRYGMIGEIPFNYQFLVLGHSHVALLGWLYLSIYIFIIKLAVRYDINWFYQLFWLTQLSVIGMMISFPLQGYAVFSIIFSTLHILCSYAFVFKIWKHLAKLNSVSKLLLKWSLTFMLISTLGVWFLGYVMKVYGATSPIYDISIQWFLHFQFNGWFVFVVLGLVSLIIPHNNLDNIKNYVSILAVSVILSVSLPIFWFTEVKFLYWINVVSVPIQFISMFFILKFLLLKSIKLNTSLYFKIFISIGLSSLFLKIFFQLATIHPLIATAGYNYRNLLIGFIHLLMLGAISSIIISLIIFTFKIEKSHLFKTSILLFIAGIISTEVLMASQGFTNIVGESIKYYFHFMFFGSLILFLGITGMTIYFIKNISLLKQ